MKSRIPLVSICIPTYQGAPWIHETIESALAQDYPAIEVIVSDDASIDGTANVAASFQDERIRVVRSDSRLGMAGNWNRSVRACRGEFIKFLMQDDRLEPDCVSTMAALLCRDPSIGFVFSTRRLQLDGLSDHDARQSQFAIGILHRELEPLGDINVGRSLLELMKRERFKGNRFGEPTVVMVRRSALQRVGLFNIRLGQLTDLEMWLRIAAFYDVGFVRRPLAIFRVHGRSASIRNRQSGAAWMDRVWMFEGIRQHQELQRLVGRRMLFRVWVGTAKREVMRQAMRVLTGHWPEGRRIGHDIRSYIQWLRTKPHPKLHERLDPSEPLGGLATQISEPSMSSS